MGVSGGAMVALVVGVVPHTQPTSCIPRKHHAYHARKGAYGRGCGTTIGLYARLMPLAQMTHDSFGYAQGRL
jgi:hypothetical protein